MASVITRRRPIRLTEDFFSKPVGPLKVDREQGIIFGVKVCGWKSKRGRVYTPEAAKKALPLYENVDVYTDHDEKNPTAVRKDNDAFGKLRNVRVEPDGVYADLYYLKSHPLAEAVCEDVSRALGVYGLSHNADGRGTRNSEGDLVIHDIDRVYSVDLVTRPATVENLWESEAVKETFKQFVAKSKAPASVKKLLLPLVEEYGSDDGEGDDWKQHALNAIKSALDSEEPEKAREVIKKIMALLMPDAPLEKEESESDSGPSDKGPTEEKPEGDAKGKEGKAEIESLRFEVDQMKREKKYRTLCEAAGIRPSEKFITSLSNLQEADAKVMIEEYKASAGTKTQTVIRSQGPGAKPASRNGAFALSESCDAKEFSRSLKRIPRG